MTWSELVKEIKVHEEAALRAAGYEPVIRWRRHNDGHAVECTTGEALKNVELEERARRRRR